MILNVAFPFLNTQNPLSHFLFENTLYVSYGFLLCSYRLTAELGELSICFLFKINVDGIF